jgi:acyl-CoA thioesterase FadM
MEIYNTHDPSFNRLALGVLVRVSRAKYLGFARLGDTLRAKVLLSDCIGNIFDFTSTIHVGERVIMKNRFRLSNVPTETLIGEAPSAKV